MRRLGIVAALVAVLSLVSAQAQGPILPGPGLPVASGGGASVALVSKAAAQSSFAARTSFSNAINVATTAGANNLLIVSLHFAGNPGAITSCTYNGVAMTQFGTTFVATEAVAIFFLLNPATGAGSGLTLACSWTNSVIVGWIGSEYSGVNVTTPLFNAVTGSGTSASPSMTVSGVAAGDGSYAANTNAAGNISTNTQNLIVSDQMIGGTSGLQTSYSLATGSVVFTWNNFNSVTWAGTAVEIAHQ